jgi:Rrf2 family protein
MQSFLTRECDYAIRITAFLAGLKSKPQMSVSELSEKLNISKIYAARIIHKLKNNGILKTTQGLYGGVSLNRSASKISVFDILNAMDFKSNLNECLGNNGICSFPSFCKVHLFMAEQEKRLNEEFKKAKISDLAFDEAKVTGREELKALE